MIPRLIDRIRGRLLTVVLPEGKDPRIVAAARRLKDEGIANPILLGSMIDVAMAATAADAEVEDLTLIDPAASDCLERYSQHYSARRGLALNIARRIVKRPLYFAGMMVARSDAHSMVAGATCATAAVISAGVLTVGLAAGVRTPSSFFLMTLPDRQNQPKRAMIYADCAMNISPTPAQLADIAIASAASARCLLDEPPRVAMLSFSTQGSASHAAVRRVTEALAIARRKAPELEIDGEFQGDAALAPAVAAKKLKRPSSVAGRANVLIFPDLNSGNIAYKLTEYLAGAEAVGPILQGFKQPISDLSRGATVDDVIDAAMVCLAQTLDRVPN